MDRSDEIEYYIATFKKIFFSAMSNYNPYAEEYEQLKLVVSYLEVFLDLCLYHVNPSVTMSGQNEIHFLKKVYNMYRSVLLLPKSAIQWKIG